MLRGVIALWQQEKNDGEPVERRERGGGRISKGEKPSGKECLSNVCASEIIEASWMTKPTTYSAAHHRDHHCCSIG